MFGKYTLRFLLFAVIMDIFSYSGLDPEHIFLYMTNPVSWIINFFPNIPYGTKMAVIYVGNLVFWFFVGRYTDKVALERTAGNE